MNILIIGSGGREHALAWKSAQDESVSNVSLAEARSSGRRSALVVNGFFGPS